MNKDLYNKIIDVPKELLDHLTICFQQVPNSDSSVEGHKRNEELRDSGYVTYQQLGRIKNWFDNYDGDGTDAPYILNGADYMKNWVENTIQDLRRQDTTHPEVEDLKPEPMDEDDFDLEEIIRELEQELDGKNDPMTEEGDEKGEVKFETEKPEYVEEEEKPEAFAEGDEKAEPVSEEDEEIDLDEILREMGYGDDEKMEGEEEEMKEGADEEKAELQADLEEAYKVIKSLKSTINEVNLLNAKLLYTNKLFRSYDLTNEQKHKVVETLDRTQNVREVKLVFSTLAESMKIGGTAKKVKQQTKMNESFASKKVASTAPKTIIAESNSMAERFKKLANIK